MRLDWNDIQARAARFVEQHKDDHYKKGQTQSFYNDFFDVFGVPLRRVASFEKSVTPKPGERGFIDLFWPGKLMVEQKSAGRDLKKAKEQALDSAIDGLYRREPFPSDRERVEHLFGLYEKLTATLFTEPPKKKGRKKS